MKWSNLITVPMLVLSLVNPVLADTFSHPATLITNVQIGGDVDFDAFADQVTVFVNLVEGQGLVDSYWFEFNKSDAASVAIYHGLLSSLATGSAVTLSGTEECFCGTCDRTIEAITLE